jgi:glutathione S-transferase
VIKDLNTGKVISDSNRIATYLDETYPEHPLVPLGTSGLQFAFQLLIYQILQSVRCGYLRGGVIILNNALHIDGMDFGSAWRAR